MIFIYRIIADNSIVIMPGVSSVDAHSKLTTALKMVDSEWKVMCIWWVCYLKVLLLKVIFKLNIYDENFCGKI